MEDTYALDSVFETLFADSDITTIADLYWLLYNGKNTTDHKLIVKLYSENIRPFGVFGRAVVADWVDDEKERLANFAVTYNQGVDNAIKLFATRYFQYFRQFWKLDELIKAVAAALRKKKLEEKEKLRLEALSARLKKIRDLYKSASSANKRKKSTKSKK